VLFIARLIIEKYMVKYDSGIVVSDTDIDQIIEFIYDN
jgi:hypothetical protein